ncbi:hypothetical protein, partial [Parasphingorhabdus sp.]|uniref:hypothetical protein n=1 Tax=Parasphingorhabdus sp. TaxID=2709688 RepID=UPI0035945E77
LAAEAEARPGPPVAAEAELEFYAVQWPDADRPPEYYRMTPEEAADMEGDVPGLTATSTGTSDDAMINALVTPAELAELAAGQFGARWAEKAKKLC